jgi:hypothetical protein
VEVAGKPITTESLPEFAKILRTACQAASLGAAEHERVLRFVNVESGRQYSFVLGSVVPECTLPSDDFLRTARPGSIRLFHQLLPCRDPDRKQDGAQEDSDRDGEISFYASAVSHAGQEEEEGKVDMGVDGLDLDQAAICVKGVKPGKHSADLDARSTKAGAEAWAAVEEEEEGQEEQEQEEQEQNDDVFSPLSELNWSQTKRSLDHSPDLSQPALAVEQVLIEIRHMVNFVEVCLTEP